MAHLSMTGCEKQYTRMRVHASEHTDKSAILIEAASEKLGAAPFIEPALHDRTITLADRGIHCQIAWAPIKSSRCFRSANGLKFSEIADASCRHMVARAADIAQIAIRSTAIVL